MSSNDRRSGAIGWMASNPVAANLLMAVVMVAGLISLMDLRKEVFPTFPTEMIRITVPYPGSSPAEVEEGILIKIEEALQDMEGIEEMTSEARENVGTVLVQMYPNSDMPTALNDVTSRINAIASFPLEAEKPVIEEILAKVQTINLTIAGSQLSEHELKALAEEVRDDLLATEAITQIDLVGVRDYELAIELSDATLRQYGLTFDQVVNIVRSKSANLPGGNLRTHSGTITLRSQGQAYSGEDYRKLPLLTRPDGTRLLLGDIANVRDDFSEQPILSRLNGERGARLTIYTLGSQNALQISEAVKNYVADKRAKLPEGVTLNAWFDNSRILKGRIDLLLKNAAQGGLLVLIALTLFLRLSMAFWVLIGVPFSFLGAMWMMGLPMFDYSINVLSLFGFLLVLGIVVDDAIVTGESGYTYLEREKQGLDSIVHGVKRVSVATIFGVLTTMIAFTPMLTMTSDMGRFGSNIAFVVIACLFFSLIETKLILPTHLRHIDVHKERRGLLPALQKGFDRLLTGFIQRVYIPTSKELSQFERRRTLLDDPDKTRRIDVSKIDPTTFNIVDHYLKVRTFRLCKRVVPNYKKAKQIFDFCAEQSCHLPGPYDISHCIPFQYVRDGCYARAHKMRWIITSRYRYCCEKVFSFANQGVDRLAVRASKWSGCCVTWWYHVAPLIRVRVKLKKLGNVSATLAMVIDPSMFDKPVLLSSWLAAQENTSCHQNANVSMYSIQPGSAYSPANYQGTSFTTDPSYTATNITLVNYRHLVTCP